MAQNRSIMMDIGEGLSLIVGLPTIAAWNSNNRPKFPRRGTLGFNSETNSLEYWDGTSWLSAPMDRI